jgi:hypothetical protein
MTLLGFDADYDRGLPPLDIGEVRDGNCSQGRARARVAPAQ